MASILKDYQGIVGTIIGVIGTLITTQWIKRVGKTYFDFNNCLFEMGKWSFEGDYKIVHKANESQVGKYSFEVNIYNSCEQPKSLKNIKIGFDIGNNNLYYYGLEDLEILNLEPKKMKKLNLKCNLKKEDLLKIEGFKAVYFTAQNHKNKEIKELINEVN